MTRYAVAMLCVLGLAVGQLLFKLSAVAFDQSGSYASPRGLAALLGAMGLYGLTSVAWVWVLQKVELGRVYPLMALAFVLVPLGSHVLFGERFHYQYYAGVVLIVLGILLSIKN